MKRETVSISAGVFSLSKTSWSKVKFSQLVLSNFGHGSELGKKLNGSFFCETSDLIVQVDMEHLTIHMPIHFNIFQIAWVF